MKRLALFVAATAACVLFTACPDKPDDGQYYSEEIALLSEWPQQGRDTTRYFRQEFTLKDDTLIYDPVSSVNSDRPYVYWSHVDNPICAIVNDTIIYFHSLDADHLLGNYLFKSIRAKVNWAGKKRDEFTFSYTLDEDTDYIMSAKHTCHRIKHLSD